MLGAAAGGLPADLVVARHDSLAQRREAGAAASGAPGRGLDQGPAEGLFEGFQEQPGLAVAHLHPGRRLADRAGARDQFEQADLARPERRAVVEIDADAELGYGRTRTAHSNLAFREGGVIEKFAFNLSCARPQNLGRGPSCFCTELPRIFESPFAQTSPPKGKS